MPLEEDNKLTCDYAHSAGPRCESASVIITQPIDLLG